MLARQPRARRADAQALDLWLKLREITEEGSSDEWEPRGRRREFLSAYKELMRCLGLSFGGTSPIEANCEEPPPYVLNNPLQAGYWREAWS